MSTRVQFRRGTTAQHEAFAGANAEVTVDTDKKTLVVHDGQTVGGYPLGSFRQAGTGAVERTVTDKLRDTVSVKDFKTVGDGTADDTAKISAAVANCLLSGRDLFWPAGDYLTTASIPNFHDVKHYGPGRVLRGTDVWHITPGPDDENILHVSPSGSDANDGLTSAQPVANVGRVNTIWQSRGFLEGQWTASLAASTAYDYGVTFTGFVSTKPVQIKGPAVSQAAGQGITFALSALSGVFQVGETITGQTSGATATVTKGSPVYADILSGEFGYGEDILGGTSGATGTVDNYALVPKALIGPESSSAASGWRADGVDLVVQDVKARNFDSGASAFGFAAVDSGKLYLVNAHVSKASRGAAGFKNVKLDIKGGVFEECTSEGIISLFNTSHSIGQQNAGTTQGGPIIRLNNVGFSAREASSGHLDWCSVYDNTFGIESQVNARINAIGTDFKRNAVAVRGRDSNLLIQRVGAEACQFYTGTVDANSQNVRYQGYTVDLGLFSDANTARTEARDLTVYSAPADTNENTAKTFQLGKDDYLATSNSAYFGKKIKVSAKLSMVGTAGTKALRLKIDNTAVSALVIPAATAGRVSYEVDVFITNRTEQVTFGEVRASGHSEIGRATTSIDLGDGDDHTLSLTLQKGASADDIIVQAFEVNVDG